jgi:hypothetical protein
MRIRRPIAPIIVGSVFCTARVAWGADLTAECATTLAGEQLSVAIALRNDTADAVTAVTPAALQVTPTGTARFDVVTEPRPWRELLRNKSVTFKWKGRVAGTGSLVIRTEVTALRADGTSLTTGAVTCAPVVLAGQQPTPTPTSTPTPAAVRLVASPTPRPTRTATTPRSPTPVRTKTPVPCPSRGDSRRAAGSSSTAAMRPSSCGPRTARAAR